MGSSVPHKHYRKVYAEVAEPGSFTQEVAITGTFKSPCFVQHPVFSVVLVCATFIAVACENENSTFAAVVYIICAAHAANLPAKVLPNARHRYPQLAEVFKEQAKLRKALHTIRTQAFKAG